MDLNGMKKKNNGSGKHCVVKGCHNNSKKIRKWKLTTCEIHNQETRDTREHCPWCVQPYQMHRFPSEIKPDSAAKRKQWVKNINLKGFQPKQYSTVCSKHFQDGRPTTDHPYPTLHMGYDNKYEKLSPGRPAPRRRIMTTPKSSRNQEQDNDDAVNEVAAAVTCTAAQTEIETKDASIQWYDATIADHNYANFEKIVKTQSKSTQTEQLPEVPAATLDNTKAKFYTGLSMHVFWAFVSALQMSVPNLPKFKLAIPDQILLILMRLRLGLMFTDLGIRFKVSQTTACDIFAFWLPMMAAFMKENVHPKATCIVECTEAFVQRSKNLKNKSHNTYKALYRIAPNGMVTYVSKLFGGSASDTFISKNSLPGDEVLADHGFTIADILPAGVKLCIPAFIDRRLPEEYVTETRRIANVRIHVERVIRQLKCFKILANILPGRIKNVDDILIICAGLCNLQPCLINKNETESKNENDETINDEEFNEGDISEMDARYLFDIAEVDF